MKLVIIDYGAGNTKSVMNAFARLGITATLTDNRDDILSADKVVLPGVGHAAQAMDSLQNKGLVDVIPSIDKPLLGICLGMQLLCSRSQEGDTTCLGIIEDQVKLFDRKSVKVPKIGWNAISVSETPILEGVDQQDFYFVHSYYVPSSQHAIAQASYGIDYTVALRKDNFYGVQFHPEKSAKPGSIFLQNFLEL